MFGNAFGWPHLLLILAVVLLLFGATRLPALAKSVGQSMKVFRKEMKSEDEPAAAAAAETPTADKPADKS
jgi:sec-independent protein translocase protein TatA